MRHQNPKVDFFRTGIVQVGTFEHDKLSSWLEP